MCALIKVASERGPLSSGRILPRRHMCRAHSQRLLLLWYIGSTRCKIRDTGVKRGENYKTRLGVDSVQIERHVVVWIFFGRARLMMRWWVTKCCRQVKVNGHQLFSVYDKIQFYLLIRMKCIEIYISYILNNNYIGWGGDFRVMLWVGWGWDGTSCSLENTHPLHCQFFILTLFILVLWIVNFSYLPN